MQPEELGKIQSGPSTPGLRQREVWGEDKSKECLGKKEHVLTRFSLTVSYNLLPRKWCRI